jgi:hypothetical protein
MTGDSSLIQTGRTRQAVVKLTYQVLIILVVVQVTLIASWAWLWLLLWNSALNQPFVLQFAAVIGIACSSGLISRLILRGQAALLRWLCAMLSALASLVGTFLLTRGLVGFPLPLAASPSTNWNGLVQVLTVGCITWIVLFASLKKPAGNQSNEELPVAQFPTTSENLIETIRQHGQPISLYQQRPTREDNLQHVVPQPSNPVWLHLREMVVSAPVQRQSPSKPAIQPKSRSGKRKKQSASIRFMGQEEHRCPYCLQIVDTEDMKTVVVCPVCNAHHHRSCWEITGSCQVPHLTR